MISQLTVFLANEKGRLAAASRVLSDAGINMQALFIVISFILLLSFPWGGASIK